MTSIPIHTRSLKDIAQAYDLSLLQEPADWSLLDGDLDLTADGDIKVGTTAYNALFRLVWLWQINEPHFRYLLDAVNNMSHWRVDLLQKLDGLEATPTSTNPWAGFERFAERFRSISDSEGVAHLGANTYAGCLLIAFSNALRRFKDDLAAGDTWRSALPSFNGYSVGRIIVAAAIGYRHEDEWAKASEMNKKQKRSYDVITGALAGQPALNESTVARSIEIVQLLSNGDYDLLAKNVLSFANNVALSEQARS